MKMKERKVKALIFIATFGGVGLFAYGSATIIDKKEYIGIVFLLIGIIISILPYFLNLEIEEKKD
ncbi:MAG: hypothetical protein AB1779_12285 [Candidatus Thermoplasmatota archaeon]